MAYVLIIRMKKLLDSDWLRAVQFKCNASAKSVTLVQLHILILDYDLQKDDEKFCRPMISCKAMAKIFYGNSEKSFFECEKMASRNIFWHIFLANFFMFVFLISNHTVFLVVFDINLHLWVFQKMKLHSPKRLVQFQGFENSLVQIKSKLNSKPYDYLY